MSENRERIVLLALIGSIGWMAASNGESWWPLIVLDLCIAGLMGFVAGRELWRDFKEAKRG